MKLYSLIPVVLLGMAVLVQAQPVALPRAPKATGDANNPNMNADGSVTLSAGLLHEVVAEIERRIGHWTLIEGGEQLAMPNLIYANDASNAEVPGNLRLRGVSPLQAVAFAAAAAGCTLEPIFGPKEASAASPQKAIGYRILRGSELTRLGSSVRPTEDPLAGIGLALARTNRSILVGQIVPGSPASSSSAIKPGQRILSVAEAGQPDVDVTGLPLEQAVQLIRGAPGTPVKITFGADSDNGPTKHVVTLVREKLPVRTAESVMTKVRVVNPNPRDSGASGPDGSAVSAVEGQSRTKSGTTPSRVPSTRSAQGHEPFVRIYAIGFILTGTNEEQSIKVEAVKELIQTALSAANLDLHPDLNIHQRTGTLISKATAAQHEIIEQVVLAMKENATLLAAPAKP